MGLFRGLPWFDYEFIRSGCRALSYCAQCPPTAVRQFSFLIAAVGLVRNGQCDQPQVA